MHTEEKEETEGHNGTDDGSNTLLLVVVNTHTLQFSVWQWLAVAMVNSFMGYHSSELSG